MVSSSNIRSPLPTFVAKARNLVKKSLQNVEVSSKLVLVACSGGADSLALAFVTAFVAPKLGFKIGAIIVDHNMQKNSDKVAADVAHKLVQYGFDPIKIVSVQVDVKKVGPEAAARAVRYEALQNFADSEAADAVLLGHTLDDQAETVLLGLARGSGARSLAGMQASRGIFLRPFLELSRKETLDICSYANLDPWHDPSNADLSLCRVRVRKKVLPVLQKNLDLTIVKALARTAKQLQDDANYLDQLALEHYGQVRLNLTKSCTIVLSVEKTAVLGKAIRRRVLVLAAKDSGAKALNYVHVAEIDNLLVAWRGQGVLNIPGFVKVVRVRNNLLFEKCFVKDVV